MFSLEQIQTAHKKVKSGADFPAYVTDLDLLGVSAYETFVADGHSEYESHQGEKMSSAAKYKPLAVATNTDVNKFKDDLKAHQSGQTDYPTFCTDCAKSGIHKWRVDIKKSTCTYYDNNDNQLLTEDIPK